MEKTIINDESLQTDIYCLKDAIDPQNTTYQKIYYEFNGEIKNGYDKHETYNGVITFRLPESIKPHDIQSINFPSATQAKISWGGSWYRTGHNINELLSTKQKSFIDYASNAAACNPGTIEFKNDRFELMWIKESAGADLRCNQYVWFNWFFENDKYYIQILYHQYAETWGSTMGGAMWLYLGNNLEIKLFEE